MYRNILPSLSHDRALPVMTPNRFYRVTPTLLPGTAERFNAYRRTNIRTRNALVQLRPDDVISFYFDPRPDAHPYALAAAYENDINAHIETLHLPLMVHGNVSIYLTNVNSPDDFHNAIGGMAQLEYNFDVRPDINLEAFLDLMEERMYRGFQIDHIGVRIDIVLSDFVRANFRGGDDPLACIPNMPRSKYPLPLCDFWPSSYKATFQRMYRKVVPCHLRNVKGLLLIKWNHSWSRHCAVMAIVYGVVYLRFQLKLRNLWVLYGKSFDDPFVPEEPFFSRLLDNACADSFLIREPLQECSRLEDGQTLYMASQALLEKVQLPTWPTHYQIGTFFNMCYPSLTLVVVDESRHILFMRTGDECPINDPPSLSYIAGRRPLTWEAIHRIQDNRVYIFYDHILGHYHPIYNLERFLSRRTAHLEVKLKYEPPVAVPEVRSSPDRKMTFCPFCDAGIDANKVRSHSCNILRCMLCDQIFTNESTRRAHMNPEVMKKTSKCGQCKRKCYGFQCLKQHQAVCDGTVYIQCQSCFGSVLSSRISYHRCNTYHCNGCQKMVRNPVQYHHPDHPNGYVKYHPCAMLGKEDSSVGRIDAKLSDNEIRDSIFFAFDFECMLTVTQFRETNIHIHSVNCVSSAEILMKLSTPSCQPRIWTQSSLCAFWRHICEVSSSSKNFWIAHNFKGYDGRLLFDYFQTCNIIPTQMLWQGGKIMQMQIQHPQHPERSIIFQDSLSHIATSLARMPSMFGLDSSIVKKGFFPYMFNTPVNQHYVGLIPPLDFFDVDNQHDKKGFMEWYNDWVDQKRVYNLQCEMRDYCENDVLVLSLSLSCYARICLDYSQLNPLPFLTIAQFTFTHYRLTHLPCKTIFFLDESFDTFARRALHGGNTNVRQLFYECSPEEAGTLDNGERGLRYIDVQSLYPTVQFYDPMPVGYPTTSFYYSEHSQPRSSFLETFFGFIECDIAPVRFMHHPLLGRFKENRLFMDLHPHVKIVLTSAEFQMAISERGGYKCSYVYRIDQYRPSYDLFQTFIRTWLRLKILSGKPPVPADSPQFEEYQQQLSQRLQISVQPNDFVFNPSLRTLAKLVLNSLWGKFGQRSNLVECRILRTANDNFDYHQLRRMGHIKEKSEAPLGTVAHLKKCQRLNKWNKKNVAVAAFVTAHARLRLWDIMEKLGDRVLYHDTDSIIYERRSSQDMMIQEGCFLGEWESETGSAMIHSFVGLAPKTYAYRYTCPITGTLKECIRSKGFSMKPSTSNILNYEAFRKMAMTIGERGLAHQGVCGAAPQGFPHADNRSIEVPTTLFRHDPSLGMTFTTNGFKILVFGYQKGFIDYRNWKTYPYGTQLFMDDPIFKTQTDHVISSPITDREAIEILCNLGDDFNDSESDP